MMNYNCLGRSFSKGFSSYHLSSFFRLNCRPISVKSRILDRGKKKKTPKLTNYAPKEENIEWSEDQVVYKPGGLGLIQDAGTDYTPGGYKPAGEPWKRSWVYLPRPRMSPLERKRFTKYLQAEKEGSPVIPQRQAGTHLHWAVDPWKEMEVRRALEKGSVDINQQNGDGRTPLHLVAQQNLPEAAQLLLDFGANVDIEDRRGFTPLHCAILYKAKDVIAPLLDAGANIDARNQDQETPLSIAIRRNSVPVTKILLEKGANIKPRKGVGSTAVHLAAKLRRKLLLEMLLDKGGDIESRDRHGRTPLHYSAEKDDYKAAFMLLKRGAKRDIQDLKGNTPLHLALENNSEKTTVLLIQMGASTSIPNPSGGILDPELVKIASKKSIRGVEGLETMGLRATMRPAGQKTKAVPQMGVGENWAEEIYDRSESKRLKNRELRLKRIDSAKRIEEKWKSPYVFPGSEPEDGNVGDGMDKLKDGLTPSKKHNPPERRHNPSRYPKGGLGGSSPRGKPSSQKKPYEE